MEKRSIIITGALLVVAIVILILFLSLNVESDEDPFSFPASLDSSSCPKDFSPLPLILISLDGFTPSYLERGVTPTLKKMIEKGSSAPYMTPSFPSLTFPNHYTIVTGLHPNSHGIIANSFYDPEFGTKFSYKNNESRDGRWWGGEPIWNTLTKHNLGSATYFWPGSEAPIQGHQPTYWFPYSKNPPIFKRLQKVFEWLSFPKEKRPSWISIYDNEPDVSGHAYGPDSDKVTKQVKRADNVIKQILRGLQKRNLLQCVNILVLSDHGMASSGPEKSVHLEELLPEDFSNKIYFSPGSVGRITLKKKGDSSTRKALEASVACRRTELRLFRREELPKRLHYGSNGRIGDYVLLLDDGFAVNLNSNFSLNGQHGYDNFNPSMQALFVAYGPSFKENFTIAPFRNTEVYNLMCDLMGVKAAPNNGTDGLLRPFLRHPPTPAVIVGEKDQGFQTPKVMTTEALRGNYNASDCTTDSDAAFENIVRLVSLSEAEQTTLRDRVIPWGIPRPQNPKDDIKLLHHPQHLTGYSTSLKVPLWTSFIAPTGLAPKPSFEWTSDPRLDPATTPSCVIYHNITDGQPDLALRPLFPTEFSANATTQILPSLISNGVLLSHQLEFHWTKFLLNLVVEWANNSTSPLNVLIGPIVDRDSDGVRDEDILGPYPAVIATDYFAILTRCSSTVEHLKTCPEKDLDSLAFIYPQKLSVDVCFSSEEDYALFFSANIRDVETLTGLQLFPLLGDGTQRASFVAKEKNQLW